MTAFITPSCTSARIISHRTCMTRRERSCQRSGSSGSAPLTISARTRSDRPSDSRSTSCAATVGPATAGAALGADTGGKSASRNRRDQSAHASEAGASPRPRLRFLSLARFTVPGRRMIRLTSWVASPPIASAITMFSASANSGATSSASRQKHWKPPPLSTMAVGRGNGSLAPLRSQSSIIAQMRARSLSKCTASAANCSGVGSLGQPSAGGRGSTSTCRPRMRVTSSLLALLAVSGARSLTEKYRLKRPAFSPAH